MKYSSYVAAVLLLAISPASAQNGPLVSSHVPAVKAPGVNAAVAATAKPVARVNGAVLTESDLLREMYTIFPYARQHNGFPKDMEPQIRKGALDMIIFEELLYQEAQRRHLTVPTEKLAQAEGRFRKQFPNQTRYEQYLRIEFSGSKQVLREKIRRSLLIERMLKSEVDEKARVTPVALRQYYDTHAADFQRQENFRIQTISIIPPPNGGAEVEKEARKRAEEAVRLAKSTKNYQEFGLLAEKISDDDWHVNMGDRKVVERSKLPPEVIKAALNMKPGQVSDLIQLGSAFTVIRLVEHVPAGKIPFAEAKAKLQSELQKQRTQEVRTALNQKLSRNAKIEKL